MYSCGVVPLVQRLLVWCKRPRQFCLLQQTFGYFSKAGLYEIQNLYLGRGGNKYLCGRPEIHTLRWFLKFWNKIIFYFFYELISLSLTRDLIWAKMSKHHSSYKSHPKVNYLENERSWSKTEWNLWRVGSSTTHIGCLWLSSAQGNLRVIWCTCDICENTIFKMVLILQIYYSFTAKRFVGFPCDNPHKSYFLAFIYRDCLKFKTFEIR